MRSPFCPRDKRGYDMRSPFCPKCNSNNIAVLNDIWMHAIWVCQCQCGHRFSWSMMPKTIITSIALHNVLTDIDAWMDPTIWKI